MNLGSDVIYRLIARMQKARRGLEHRMEALFEEREIVRANRQRMLERELDEPGYIEIRRGGGSWDS